MENLFFKKNPLQDLHSSLNAVISTNEMHWIIIDHVIFKLRYNQMYQLETTMFIISFQIITPHISILLWLELLIRNHGLKLMYQVSSNRQNSLSIMFFCHFIEKLDNICKVHISVKNDIPVVFYKSHSHKEIKVARRHHSGSPDCFPNQKDITVGKFSLEIQQKPPERWKVIVNRKL